MSRFSFSNNFEGLGQRNREESIEEKYSEKIKKDYGTCAYPKEIKDLLSSIFSIKNFRKCISTEINTREFPMGKITKDTLQEALSKLSEILNILNNPNPSTSNSASRLDQLSKDFYRIIPFNESTNSSCWNS